MSRQLVTSEAWSELTRRPNDGGRLNGPAIVARTRAPWQAGSGPAPGGGDAASSDRPDEPLLPAEAWQAGFFGPHARSLFGCYHPPASGAEPSPLGVLLCSPFGCEDLSAHRSLRVLALQLAGEGLPVLRFDMDGCGDSAGQDSDPGRVAAWVASISAAIDALRRQSGCAQVALVGVRLGALLAAQAARTRSVLNADVALLMAIAPAVSGRRYLRECLALGGMRGQGSDAASQGDLLESGGFYFTRSTREALGQLDLAQTELGALPAVHIFERAEMPSAGPWVKRLQADSVPVTVESFEGYAQMMDEPHRAVVPQALWQAVNRTLLARARQLRVQSGAVSHSASALRFGRAVAAWDALLEQPVQIPLGSAGGDDEAAYTLFGMLSRPASGVPVKRAVLMLNAGSIRRVGPSRLYLNLARRWAPQGVMVLRLDLSGLGDSAPSPGQPDNVVYGHRAIAEVRAAVAWLLDNSGLPQCTLMGLCAGGSHSLKAAPGLMRGRLPAVEQVVLLNPLVFDPVPGQSIDNPWAAHRLQGLGDAFQQPLWNRERWQRLWQNNQSMAELLAKARRFAVWQFWRRLRRLSEALHLPVRTALARQLDLLADQGTGLHFVFASDEPGLGLLREQGGRSFQRRQREDWLRVHHVTDADHVFIDADARERLTEVLDALVRRPTP